MKGYINVTVYNKISGHGNEVISVFSETMLVLRLCGRSWRCSHCGIKLHLLIAVLMYTFLIPDTLGDICDEDVTLLDMRQAIHQSAIPLGGPQAGVYTKIRDTGSDIKKCILSCCEVDTCDVVFYHQQKCYQIRCNRTFPGACNPVSKTEAKFNTTFYVTVRDVEYVQPPVKAEKTCEYGIVTDCGPNEECVLRPDSKSRVGLCLCMEGFQTDEHGECVAIATSTPSTTLGPGTSKMAAGNMSGGRGDTVTVPVVQIKSTTSKVTKLTVSAGKNKEIQLPNNTITLSAFVVPEQVEGESPYQYEWILVHSPDISEKGTMDGRNTKTLKLSKLIEGLYTFKVTVSGDSKYGEGFVNITVKAPARKNKKPVAITKPKSQVIHLPNSAIIDGSDSTDDDKIVKYHWEEESGPLQSKQIMGEEQMITLSNLAPGNYTFKLTVTDSDGKTDSTLANVTFIQDKDYPPKANAGSDVIINLPQMSLTLYGNASTDDKGIVSYEWVKKADDKLTADMTGVRTPFLHLDHLEEGDYMFTLKVMDAARQTATADVHVFVKPETNRPPVAETAGQIVVFLPTDKIVLDGSNSTDNVKITKYFWEQMSGPVTLTVTKADSAVAMTTGEIATGEYVFKLTVTDGEKRIGTAPLTVTVKENQNKPPVANAGGDRVVYLPLKFISLDGSKSEDDREIISYRWTRDEKSLAAGDIVNGSDHSAVLQLVNMITGRYTFELRVMDAEGLSAIDTASVIVKEDPHVKDLLEIVMNADIKHFTQENKESLVNTLQLLLHKSSTDGSTIVNIRQLTQDPSTGYLHIMFLVKLKLKEDVRVWTGVDVLKILKKKLISESSVVDYPIIRLDTVVCQNNCSGHGHCDHRSKLCVCEAFWMQNFVKALFFQKESNCDWSILYVVIVCFVAIVTIAGAVWGIICCLRSKRCRLKSRKRHRYSLLREESDDEDKHKLELMPKGKFQNSSVMISESDFSSEEETLFINHKKTNGHISKPLNGLSKQHFRTKLKT
ncbi:dyslexia-associated protein KIAA0319-like protein [Gigantopelta aegis]|uniref:dyslexia-associated protein KIAA0319-like protein n=1 Tax=Gigantopelta aegis TaxID=1735272 RepID=UPI001B8890C4|nr:dyslexia-associated protein KIAA0319-like protein [Gigantopelta aegis]